MTRRPPLPAEPDALWGRVEEALARERGPRAWLRSRATPVRVALVLVAVVLVAAAVVAALPRRDLATARDAHVAWALEGAVLVLGVLAVAALLLRPLGRPAPRRARAALIAGAGLLLPAALVVFMAGHAEEPGGIARPALFCLGLGVAFALPVVVLLVILVRRERLAVGQGLLVAAAGGLAGNLGLLLHCPRIGPAHLLLGHATVPLGLLALVALAAGWRSARERHGAPPQGEPPKTR